MLNFMMEFKYLQGVHQTILNEIEDGVGETDIKDNLTFGRRMIVGK